MDPATHDILVPLVETGYVDLTRSVSQQSAIARVEARVQTIGRTLLKQAIAARPSIASTEYWKEQAGEWVLADDDLKVRLFRLVDCMPMLDDPAAIDRHLREYLDDDAMERLPAVLRMGYAIR